MSGLQCELDVREDAKYNLIVNKDRELDQIFVAEFYSGDTLYPFDFTPYSGATLQVRKKANSEDVIIEFNTSDNSIIFGIDGKFQLVKTSAEMDKTLAGQWVYDMYLEPDKRAFLSGEFIITSNVSK